MDTLIKRLVSRRLTSVIHGSSHHAAYLYPAKQKGHLFNTLINYGENHYDSPSSDSSVHAEIHACRKVARKHRSRVNKRRKREYNLVVVRTSKSGSSLGMSRLCERCVIGVSNMPAISGIKIKKIFYSSETGDIVQTTVSKMIDMSDHHLSSYSRNNGYKSTLKCSCGCD